MNQKKLVKLGCALLAGALLFGSVVTINVTPSVVYATEGAGGTTGETGGTTGGETGGENGGETGGTTGENGGETGGTTGGETGGGSSGQISEEEAKKQKLFGEASAAIGGLGTITASSGSAISDARSKYNAAAAAGCDVSSLTAALTAAETAYNEILAANAEAEKAAADQAADDAAVAAVINAINAIGEVNENSGAAIANARSLYNALSEASKAKVTNYGTLTSAESTFGSLSTVVSEAEDNTDISYAKEGNVTLMGTDASYVFIGDSRTVGMAQYVNTNQHIWSAKVGAGLSWMKSEGVPAVENKIESGSNVVILMGVNDCGNTSNEKKYATYINEKAKTWVAKGANVYYVSVNPITRDSVANGSITNAKIEAWNTAIQSDLSDDVTYIDTYNKLKGELVATDGLHYTKRGCQLIYNAILEFVEADTVEEVDEDEAKKIEAFQTKITSTTRDVDNNTVTLTVTSPSGINNVSYEIALFDSETSSWEVLTETKMSTTTIDVPEGEVKIRARAQKKYDTETAQGKWSNIVTVDAEGVVTGVEEEGLGIVGKIIIGLVIALFVFFGGYFILRKKGIIGPTPIDNVFNGIANLLEKIQKKFKKKEK